MKNSKMKRKRLKPKLMVPISKRWQQRIKQSFKKNSRSILLSFLGRWKYLLFDLIALHWFDLLHWFDCTHCSVCVGCFQINARQRVMIDVSLLSWYGLNWLVSTHIQYIHICTVEEKDVIQCAWWMLSLDRLEVSRVEWCPCCLSIPSCYVE